MYAYIHYVYNTLLLYDLEYYFLKSKKAGCGEDKGFSLIPSVFFVEELASPSMISAHHICCVPSSGYLSVVFILCTTPALQVLLLLYTAVV